MKKKIGIIIQKLNGGGAERAAANLSIDLNENYEVYLIVFNAKDIAYNFSGKLLDLGIVPTKTGFFKKIKGFLEKIYKIRKIKKEYRFDYTISFMENANTVNIFTRTKKEKIVISERNRISFFNKSILKKFIIKYNARKSDDIIALSKGVMEDLIDEFKIDCKKITVIYNSCDPENLITKNFNTLQLYNNLDDNYKYIVNMGRLHYQKGQWHLIKAFSLIASKYKNLKLIIIGEGDLKKDLEKLIKELNLQDRVILTGFLKEPHIILKKCEIFVFSSIVEGLGNVLLEALNYNKAIISTDCYYGPREILAPNTEIKKQTKDIEFAEYGVLVPNWGEEKFDGNLEITREEEIYAKAVEMLLIDSNLRKKYEINASKRAEDFLPVKIKKDWNNFFERE